MIQRPNLDDPSEFFEFVVGFKSLLRRNQEALTEFRNVLTNMAFQGHITFSENNEEIEKLITLGKDNDKWLGEGEEE